MPNHRKRVKTPHGISLIELMVSIVIIGIAVAGITETTWFNGLWSMRALSKIDNIYAAKQFLSQISRELRQTTSIINSSNNQSITLTFPSDPDTYPVVPNTNQKVVDPNGFPVWQTTATYSVVPDPTNLGQYLIQVLYTTNSVTSGPTTVLHGLVGPLALSGGQPAVFQYIDKYVNPSDPQFGVANTPTTNVGCIIINLELRRTDFGYNSNAAQVSLEGLKTEVFLRNAIGIM